MQINISKLIEMQHIFPYIYIYITIILFESTRETAYLKHTPFEPMYNVMVISIG